MTLPATITTVTVSGFYLLGDSPASGSVTFTPSVTASTPGAVLPVAPLTVELVDGALSVELPATDDPQWAAAGWTYTVTERIDGARPRSYSIEVPSAAAGTGLDLATVVPVVAPTAVTPYVLRSGSTMTGPLTLSGAPTDPLHAATKAYVDSGGGSGISPAILDAKGDLIAATGPDTPARLPVGADGRVLRAASGQAAGLEWAALTAGDVGADAAGSAAAAVASSAQRASNLSDLANAATARTNLGLGNSATRAVGTTAGTVAAGDDSRLSDARTPTAHASSHAPAGSDALSGLTSTNFAAASVDGTAGTASLRTLGTGAQQAAAGNHGHGGGGGGGYRGAWDSGTAYSAGDIVTYRRASYGAVASSTNVAPVSLVELFPNHSPANLNSSDSGAYELAVTFTVSAQRRMTRALFYKSDLMDSGAAHILSLWDSVFGLLASAAVVGETASGIQAAPLVADLMPGRTYYLSYNKLTLGNGDSGYVITTSFGWPSTVDVLTATAGRFSTAIGTMPNTTSTSNYGIWPEWEDPDGTKWDLLGRMDPMAWGDTRAVAATVRGQS